MRAGEQAKRYFNITIIIRVEQLDDCMQTPYLIQAQMAWQGKKLLSGQTVLKTHAQPCKDRRVSWYDEVHPFNSEEGIGLNAR
ncbi:hypothetical protein GUITHDRAFT_119566 [Guillardia theta CCMP2712]|uniref:Uncharacterized protein n=1 Tax=Guillardia theta (strain CCMP2712) TaxID=905079 RepID=L1IDG0_GUITC|nr:hypothetical protein GUITHDRAFT_119566 [Guillardia theta CCMP2712]EKX34276.1 hypothetical protein GUITHDRAFT_119566 [Guillardia theta CCMP2712]|eukprot:XP_005821256.1 hypothetical protein GUITHDRAFT_119566 [Guillardia theta CCMP2712]